MGMISKAAIRWEKIAERPATNIKLAIRLENPF